MNDPTPLDRFRALAEQRLPEQERARMLRELDADPGLAARYQEFLAVHVVTATLCDEPPACRTTVEDLERALARPAPGQVTWTRRVAAAAGMMALIGAAWMTLAGDGEGGPLVLSAIDLEERPVPEEAPEPPAGLADYDPRGPDGVAWLDDFEAAAWLAKASGRPLLVFGEIMGCPMCVVLDNDIFSAGSVVELAERYVPVRFDLGELPEAEAQELMRRGYPFLEVWNDDLEYVHPLSRQPDPAFFAESMRDGLAAADAEGDVASWDELRSLARTLSRARTQKAAGRIAGAQVSFQQLAEGASDLYRRIGVCGLARISSEVRTELLRAEEAALDSPREAVDLLERALERYAGTAYATDLQAVLERLQDDGRFPSCTAGPS